MSVPSSRRPSGAGPAPARPAPEGAPPAPPAAKPPAAPRVAKRPYVRDRLFQEAGATSARFVVEIDGVPAGAFSECQGLEVELQIESYEEGGVNGFERKLPGRITWPNLVLSSGVTFDNTLLDWFQRVASGHHVQGGKTERTTCAVTLTSANGRRLRSYSLDGALPVKWSGPSLASDSDELPSETLELTHHGFTVETFGGAS